jgi:hypothetical protein
VANTSVKVMRDVTRRDSGGSDPRGLCRCGWLDAVFSCEAILGCARVRPSTLADRRYLIHKTNCGLFLLFAIVGLEACVALI